MNEQTTLKNEHLLSLNLTACHISSALYICSYFTSKVYLSFPQIPSGFLGSFSNQVSVRTLGITNNTTQP